MVLGCVLGVAGVVAAVLWRLAEGPIPLRILDRPIADAIVGLAPDVTVRVGTTALVRAGRGVALEVGGIELLAPDGTPTLSLAHVRVHWRMLRLGASVGDWREVLGQASRIAAAAIFSRIWVPIGNTGRADVSALKPMPVPEDLRAVLGHAAQRTQGAPDPGSRP